MTEYNEHEVRRNKRIDTLYNLRQLMPSQGDPYSAVMIRKAVEDGTLTDHAIGVMLSYDIDNVFYRTRQWRQALAGKFKFDGNRRIHPANGKTAEPAFGHITNPRVKAESGKLLRALIPEMTVDDLYQRCVKVRYLDDLYWLNESSMKNLEKIFLMPQFWCDKLATDAMLYAETMNGDRTGKSFTEQSFLDFTIEKWEELFKNSTSVGGVAHGSDPSHARKLAKKELSYDETKPIHVEKFRIFRTLEMPETWIARKSDGTKYSYNWKNMYWLIYFDNWLACNIQRWWSDVIIELARSNGSTEAQIESLKESHRTIMWPSATPQNMQCTWKEFSEGISSTCEPTGIPMFDQFVSWLPDVVFPPPFEKYNRRDDALDGNELSMLVCRAFLAFRRQLYAIHRFDFPFVFFHEPVYPDQ